MDEPRIKSPKAHRGIRRALMEAGVFRRVVLSVELAEALDQHATAKGTTTEKLLEEIVEQYLDRHDTGQ